MFILDEISVTHDLMDLISGVQYVKMNFIISDINLLLYSRLIYTYIYLFQIGQTVIYYLLLAILIANDCIICLNKLYSLV